MSSSFNIHYAHRWRNVGLFCAFIFNVSILFSFDLGRSLQLTGQLPKFLGKFAPCMCSRTFSVSSHMGSTGIGTGGIQLEDIASVSHGYHPGLSSGKLGLGRTTNRSRRTTFLDVAEGHRLEMEDRRGRQMGEDTLKEAGGGEHISKTRGGWTVLDSTP